MAKVWFLTNTDVEYIFDYGQDIAKLNGEAATIIKDPSDGTRLILNCTKADGTSFTMFLERPKKPIDMGGTGFDVNSLLMNVSNEKFAAVKEEIINHIAAIKNE